MKGINQSSLGDHVSRKMSVWILVLVAAITVAVFVVSFVQSRQMFFKQVEGWTTVAPLQAITNLIDSDHYSIEREVKFLESTGLFSSFCIMDNQQRKIAAFGRDGCTNQMSLPIKDDAGIVWGYYSFQPDFYRFISPFVISGIVFLALIFSLYFFIRWRIQKNLGYEFFRFNQFLKNIDLLTERIQDCYHDESKIIVESDIPQNAEQAIINRAIGKLVGEIKKANQSLREAISKAEKQHFQDELTETALQVAHDIGSPLAVLEATIQTSTMTLPEQSREAIRGASAKIKDIAHALLKKGKGDLVQLNNESIAQYPLLGLVQQVVSDKRLEFRDCADLRIEFEYSCSAYGLFSMVRSTDFNRILSNMINNAVEALATNCGEIKLRLFEQGKHSVIEVEDNGKGMPDDVLARLGEMGVTYGKRDGHGLGLYHAKATIASWAGELAIQSILGHGTTVSIRLPKSPEPLWFVPDIRLDQRQTVIVVDDDESIHQLWSMRFKQVASGVALRHLYSPEELTVWVQGNELDKDNVLYLCDYEYVGMPQNGIDLIDSLKIHANSILATNRYNSSEVMDRCEVLGIKLLPKDMASMIPIVVMR